MGLTRAIAEQVAVSRCAPTMQRAQMDSTTKDGTNADLNDPIATALEELGLYAANRAAVADADLAPMLQTVQPKFLDLLEIRVLETCLNRIATQVTSIAFVDYKESRQTMLDALQKLIDWKWTQYRAKYAANSAPVVQRMCPATERRLQTWQYWPPPGGVW